MRRYPDDKKTGEIWKFESVVYSRRGEFEPARRATCASLAAGYSKKYLHPGLVKTCPLSTSNTQSLSMPFSGRRTGPPSMVNPLRDVRSDFTGVSLDRLEWIVRRPIEAALTPHRSLIRTQMGDRISFHQDRRQDARAEDYAQQRKILKIRLA